MSKSYEAVIGLEIHAQLKTKSKIFSSDSTNFDAADNENVNPVSMGMPGTLPVLNEKVIEYSIQTGLALGCEIRKKSIFARKNYFYPDLPKGYQISQYDKPICENGKVTINDNGKPKIIRIERAHIEEDAGKSNHFGDCTLINYNRAGIPLLEIVSAPDIRSAAQAAEYAKTVRQILRYLDVCDGNLEEGSLRCDCNVSVRIVGDLKLGTKVEIKNINSFRFVEKAIDYEIERQMDTLESGGKIIQETRLYDPDKNRTFSMRTKEDAQDYRYFPDPDLLPIILDEKIIEMYRSQLPILPAEMIAKFKHTYQLPDYDAEVLSEERDLAEYFMQTADRCHNPKLASNWIMTELTREIKLARISVQDCPITPDNLADLISLIDQGTISGKIAKTVFSEMWSSKKNPETIIKEKNLNQISDISSIEKLVKEVLQAHPSQVQEYKAGKTKLLGFFVGHIMKASKGQANPDKVNDILTQILKDD